MRGSALPAAMAFAALALSLGFVPRRTALGALILAAIVATVASRVPVPASWTEAAFLGCWASIVGAVVTVYLPRAPATPLVMVLAAIAGAAAGLVIAAEGTASDLLRAVLAALIVIPARVAVVRGHAVIPRVVASWLIAVALLAAIIPFAVTNPGYVPDHRG